MLSVGGASAVGRPCYLHSSDPAVFQPSLATQQVNSNYLLTFLEIIYYKNTQRPVFHVICSASACNVLLQSCMPCQVIINLCLAVATWQHSNQFVVECNCLIIKVKTNDVTWYIVQIWRSYNYSKPRYQVPGQTSAVPRALIIVMHPPGLWEP